MSKTRNPFSIRRFPASGRARGVGPAAIAAAALLAAVALPGCGKSDKPKKVKNLFSEKAPKIDYSQIKVEKVKHEPVAPKADTWASNTKEIVASIHKDLQQCRNEFMLPFQFKKMRRRNVEWLKMNAMDTVCRDGDRALKKRAPWKRVLFLAKEHTGKRPALDRWIALAVDHIEHARMVSIMAKKVGAPKIQLITDSAKGARDRVLAAGMKLDAEAAKIAAWDDHLKPLDDPAEVAKPIDFEAFKKSLDERYTYFMEDCLGQYDRSASESWQYPQMIKFRSYKLWPELIEKYLQQDRARLDKVSGAEGNKRGMLEVYFESVQQVVKVWADSNARYLKKKKADDVWTDVDPYRPPIAKALEFWAKAHDPLFGTKKAKEIKAKNKAWRIADRKRRRGRK